jgi:hypothetical protein
MSVNYLCTEEQKLLDGPGRKWMLGDMGEEFVELHALSKLGTEQNTIYIDATFRRNVFNFKKSDYWVTYA